MSALLQRIILQGKQISKVMVKRKSKLVLRYFIPNQTGYPDKYADSPLILFYLFSQKSELQLIESHAYKLSIPAAFETVNINRSVFELNLDTNDSYL